MLLSIRMTFCQQGLRGAELILTLCKLLLAGVMFSASASSVAESEFSTEDRLQIMDALAQYSYRWDGKDAAGFAQLFTEDGEMERWVSGERVNGSLVQGRKAIREYAANSHNGRLADRQTRHHFSAFTVTAVTGEFVETENMALITHQTAGELPSISSSGIYRITWKKTNQGWLIAKRVLFSDYVD